MSKKALMVETRGIEPLSKNNQKKTSTYLEKMKISLSLAHLSKLLSSAKTEFDLKCVKF